MTGLAAGAYVYPQFSSSSQYGTSLGHRHLPAIDRDFQLLLGSSISLCLLGDSAGRRRRRCGGAGASALLQCGG